MGRLWLRLAAPIEHRDRVLDAILLTGLGILALFVRLPNYQLIPAFTDEVDDAYRGFLIARGLLFPLTDTSTYIGSLWNWLVAAAFWLSGFSVHAPRALILIAGVLTVVATYPLGKTWGGRVSGLLAAALLGTSASHSVVNSHIAWSNCATPLFTTLAVWTLYVAVQGTTFNPRIALLLSGLFWGLALQTHPSVLALLPGAVIFLAWRGRVVRTRWAFEALALVALVNTNLLAYNLISGFESLSYGTTVATYYSGDQPLTPATYLERLELLLLALFRHLGGAVDLRSTADSLALLSNAGLWPIALLGVAGTVRQWRLGNPLPGLLLLSMALLLPISSGRFSLVHHARYIAPLLPILFAAAAALVAEGFERLRTSLPECSAWGRASALVGRAALTLVAAFVLFHPFVFLRSYYEQETRAGRTNSPYLHTVDQIISKRGPDEIVLLDRPPDESSVASGGGWVSSIFRLSLAVNGVPYRFIDLSGDELLDPKTRCREQLVILALRRPELNRQIVERFGLRRVELPPSGQPAASAYPFYRLERLPQAPQDC